MSGRRSRDNDGCTERANVRGRATAVGKPDADIAMSLLGTDMALEVKGVA